MGVNRTTLKNLPNLMQMDPHSTYLNMKNVGN